MDKNQKELIRILSASLRGRSVEINENQVEIEKLFEEARAHKVDGLIYTSISNKSSLREEAKTLINTYKKSVIVSAISQAQHVSEISRVFEAFNLAKVPIIALKGLVVRQYYPKPDLRTMSDADVLVHIEDLDRAREVLKILGYYENIESRDHGAHIVFYNGRCVIEVHWRLTNKQYYNGDISFEKDLWKNTMTTKLKDTDILSLGLEDLALHLCIHMAVHLACNGFGIRQLCDLVLLVEHKGALIDWNKFLVKAREANNEKFSLTIFKICNELFGMEIPKELAQANEINSKYTKLFMDDIFINGVGGKRDKSRLFATEFAFDLEEGSQENKGVVRRFFRLLFPPISGMSEKYNYAKKNVILSPIAWIHHLFEGFTNKDYSLINKIKIITCTLYISKKRNKLMNWLEI
ncbi:MAG: nucleotidyltransferase family protein [Clostridium sp.]|nr:nucleotidyltransferase family protein [Clostridium sp.]MDU7084671.1 nucleotidyltransferase family protein [Clostridium sp.]